MVDALTFAREIAHISASIAEYENLLLAEPSAAEREKIIQSLHNLLVSREELRSELEQLLSIKTHCTGTAQQTP